MNEQQQHVEDLISTGIEVNIEMALMLIKSQNIDYDIGKWWELCFHFSYFADAGRLAYVFNLERIEISGGRLPKIPKVLHLLHNLKELKLSNLALNNLPNNMSKLKSIERLYLSGNNFTELPSCVCKLSNLNHLAVSECKIDFISEEFSELQNLRAVTFSENKITKMPDSIGKLQNLRILRLRYNPIPLKERQRITKALPNCQISF